MIKLQDKCEKIKLINKCRKGKIWEHVGDVVWPGIFDMLRGRTCSILQAECRNECRKKENS